MTNSGSVHTSPRDDLCTAKNLVRTLPWYISLLMRCSRSSLYSWGRT